MKNNSQHPKPEDGEKRKLKKPVICYPNETIKIDLSIFILGSSLSLRRPL